MQKAITVFRYLNCKNLLNDYEVYYRELIGYH